MHCKMIVKTQAAHVAAYPERYIALSYEDAFHSISELVETDCFLVAVDGDEVLGYAITEYLNVESSLFLKQRQYCYLQQIGVITSYRKRGVGQILLAHIKKQCIARGITDIELDVWSFNQNGQQFFIQNEFELYASKMRYRCK